MSKDDEYIERLEKEIRELKSLVRQLSRRLKKVDREYRKTGEIPTEEPKKSKRIIEHNCPTCGKGSLVTSSIGPRVIDTCTYCDYSSRPRKP